jgi:hypothetical protein
MREVQATSVPGTLDPEAVNYLRELGCQIEREGDRTRVIWPEGTLLDAFAGEYRLPSGRVVNLRTVTGSQWPSEVR